MSKRMRGKNNAGLKNTTKIMTFGTFDGLHPGHLNFFKQARGLAENPFLVVSVARDRNVAKIKGRLPFFSERKRVMILRRSALADKVVLSGVGNHIPHIVKERPDIIALGYDQKAYVTNLREELEKKKLTVRIMRLKPYRAKRYKTHLLCARQNV